MASRKYIRPSCPHKLGRRPNNCPVGPPCSGASVCFLHHDKPKLKSACRNCTPKNFCGCDPPKPKAICVVCKGASVCPCGSGYQKYQCKNCKGNGICQHKLHKNTCIQCERLDCIHEIPKISCDVCRGTSFCKHERIKYECKACKGSAVCKHSKIKSKCKECEGASYCNIHKKQKQWCSCGGSVYCLKHPTVEKYRCKPCGGKGICKHGVRRELCNFAECEGGSALCCVPSCDKVFGKGLMGHCMTCFLIVFPEKTVRRNYKVKERAVVCHVRQQFPTMVFAHDKTIPGGCSKRRPDLLLDLLTHVVIIEVDERYHRAYKNCNEDERIVLLSEDIGHRPMVVIRINPDEGSHGPSCWGYDVNGLVVVKKKRAQEWQKRLEDLSNCINFWLTTIPKKSVKIIKMFY